MPSAPTAPGPTRRTVLLAGLAAGAGALAAACAPRPGTAGETPAGEPDPLAPLVDAARADAGLATAAAAAVPASAGLLTEVAAARSAHADALQAEVARAAGTVPGASSTPAAPSSSSASATATTPSTPPPPPPTVADVVAALAASRAAAESAAVQGPDYRAGLLGSVAAACAVAGGVLA